MKPDIAKVATELICQIVWTVWLFLSFLGLFLAYLGGNEGKNVESTKNKLVIKLSYTDLKREVKVHYGKTRIASDERT
jgi:hypothetical protein